MAVAGGTDALDRQGAVPAPRRWAAQMFAGTSGPVLVILLALLVVWYVATVWLNARFQLDTYRRAHVDFTTLQFVIDTLNQKRPVLPSPHQVFAELWNTVVGVNPISKRSLIYHSWITLSATLLGFAIGTVLGIVLAVAIVHNKVIDKSLMPWIIASQTIPILAIAPMIIVVLNAVGISGVLPKALISTYLSFFPVAVGMVKGLRAPERLELDLMHTYSATPAQTLWKLRWPSSLPYLFTSMKVAVAISLVGAIVGELPTGAVAGLGARLLSGSYYGQTTQIWAALFMAAFLAAMLVVAVGLVEKLVTRHMGGRA